MVSRALWLGMKWFDNWYCSIRKNFFSWTFQSLWNDFFAFQARPRQILKRNFDQSYVEIPGAGAAGAAGKGVSVAVFSLAGGYGHSLKPLWGSLKNVCPKQTCHSRCASGIGDSQNLKKGYVEHAVPLILVAILFVKSWNIYVCAMSRLNLPTFAFSVGCRCASRIATTWCNFPPCDVTFLHLMWLKPANCARMRSSRSANAGVRPVLDLKILRWFEQKLFPGVFFWHLWTWSDQISLPCYGHRLRHRRWCSTWIYWRSVIQGPHHRASENEVCDLRQTRSRKMPMRCPSQDSSSQWDTQFFQRRVVVWG